MPFKDLARHVRDGLIPRERLRRANRGATVASTVTFAGDPARTRLGAGTVIGGPTVLAVTDGGGLAGARLDIGERSYVGEFNNIRCAGAPIRIGRDCLISQHVTIVGSNHRTDAGTPIVDQPWQGAGVWIGDDVWIGAGAVVLPGAHVGDGAVVAANSVVRGVVDPGSVVGGTPARLLAHRPAPVPAVGDSGVAGR